MSAHRTPEEAARFSSQAKANGFGVVIAAAESGPPCRCACGPYHPASNRHSDQVFHLRQLRRFLLATVPDAKGHPVATVAIDGTDNAALLAIQILALSCAGLSEKLETMKEQMAQRWQRRIQAIQEKVKRAVNFQEGKLCWVSLMKNAGCLEFIIRII